MTNLLEDVQRAIGQQISNGMAPRSYAAAAIIAMFEWLDQPSKATLDAGMFEAEDCMDTDWSSDIDGNRYDCSYLRSDAPFKIWKAMLEQTKEDAAASVPPAVEDSESEQPNA